MMKEKVLVALLITKTEEKDLLYAINMALAQNYEPIELFVSYNRSAGVDDNQIMETIESNKKDEAQGIYINSVKKERGLKWHYDFVLKYANTNDIHYVCFMNNGDSFYDTNSLRSIMQQAQHSYLTLGNSIFYSANDEYRGEYNSQFTHQSNEQLLVDYSRQFDSDDCELRRIGGVVNLSRDEGYNRKKKVSSICYCPDVAFLKAKERNKREFNYTHTRIINKYIHYLQKTKPKDYSRQLDEVQKNIILNASSVWGIHQQDVQLLKVIWKIREIMGNKHFGDKQNGLDSVLIDEAATKIKVVFFCQNYSTWPSLKSLYEAMILDERYSTKLVYVPFHHFNSNGSNDDLQGMRNYIESGYDVIPYLEYDLSIENPDIGIFVSPYSYVPEGFDITEVSRMIPRNIYVPYGLTLESTDPELVRLRYRLPMMNLAWKVLCDDQYGLELARKYGYSDGDNLVAWGNPRLDYTRSLPLEEDVPYINKLKDKAGKRKIFLWNTHHSVGQGGCGFSSWDKYGEQILQYFLTHTDMFLLWRPHPLFKGALEKYWGKERAQQLWNQVENSENIVLDEYKSYSAAFSVSDYFVSDMSSLVKEYVFMDKPVIVTVNNEEDIVNQQLKRCLYVPSDIDELFSIISRITQGDDTKHQEREGYVNQFFAGDTKSISKTVLDSIYNELNDEIEKVDFSSKEEQW